MEGTASQAFNIIYLEGEFSASVIKMPNSVVMNESITQPVKPYWQEVYFAADHAAEDT